MQLTEARVGELVRVIGFRGGRLHSRLQRLGIYPDDRLRILRRAPLGGPLLVEVGGREIALGQGVARGIEVEAA